MRIIEVKHNQTLMDIALQEYGDVQGVFWLVDDNKELYGIVDTIEGGQELLIREEPMNVVMRDFLSSHVVATRDQSTGEGIGFWRMENEFIIS